MKKRKYPGPTGSWLAKSLMAAAVFCGSCGVAGVYAQEAELSTMSTQANVLAADRGELGSFGTSYTGEDLKKMHPTSLLQALQMAEPSLLVSDPLAQNGSNPNFVPGKISLRGEKGIEGTVSGNDVMPLILVDGYKVSIDRLQDFDVQRVKRVGVLKDAVATSLYGIQAAGGVIVIETSGPSGDAPVQLKYNFDGTFSWADLGSIDLMSGAEKLELENKIGMYAGNSELYQERKNELAERGEFDWLKEPFGMAFNHRHRVEVGGGDERFRFQGSLLAQPGGKSVMEKTSREMYGVSARVDYVARKFSISNEMRMDLVYADNDYIPVSSWMQVNPYFQPFDSRGKLLQKLGEGTFNEQASPYYEYSLKSALSQDDTRLLNNLRVKWSILDNLLLTGGFTFTRDYQKNSQFLSPISTIFDHYNGEDGNPASDRRGEYQIIRGKQTSYEEFLQLNYVQQWGEHTLSTVLGGYALGETLYSDNYAGVGIASNHMDYISFAAYYPYEVLPGNSEFYHRMLSGFASANYDYAGKWRVDLAGRIDKSSRLAPDKQVAGSWSANLAWNISNEAFLQDSEWIKSLTLKLGAGSNAGYQFDYDYVNPVYGYYLDNYYLNASNSSSSYTLGLIALGQTNNYNPALKWKSNQVLKAGLDVDFGGRVRLAVEYYNITTKNLVGLDSRNPIYGFKESVVNAGKINNSGLDIALSASIIQSSQASLHFVTRGTFNRNELKSGFSDYFLDKYNSAGYLGGMQAPLQLQAGNPVDGIYAYRSAGIDTQDGKEYFYTANGTKTLTPELSDLEYMGSSAPKFSGTAGLSGTVGRFDFSCHVGYSFGGKIYDAVSAAFIDWAGIESNLPKAAADKWTASNSSAQWQGFDANTGYASSRLVKTNNVFTLSSLHVGYRFDAACIRVLGMKSLKAGLTGNNLFYSESSDRMRGMIFPYTRSVTLSLQAIF